MRVAYVSNDSKHLLSKFLTEEWVWVPTWYVGKKIMWEKIAELSKILIKHATHASYVVVTITLKLIKL